MAESKVAHTRGPWTWTALRVGLSSALRVVRVHQRYSPERPEPQRVAELYSPDEDELMANVRLITAAPDLYEALGELVAAGELAVSSVDDVSIMLRLGRATDAAKAAIAKAEGR